MGLSRIYLAVLTVNCQTVFSRLSQSCQNYVGLLIKWLFSLVFIYFSTYDDVIVEERNEFFDSAHSAVEIRYEEGRGRFAIASKARFYNVESV